MLLPVIAGLVGTALGVTFGVAASRRKQREQIAAARAEAESTRRGARLEATALQRAAKIAAREEALELRARADDEFNRASEALVRRQERAVSGLAEADQDKAELDLKWDAYRERNQEIQSLRDSAKSQFAKADELLASALEELERRSQQSAPEVTESLSRAAVEDARAAAANRLRALELGVNDPEYDQVARRVLEVSAARYKNHFLTERMISNLPLKDGVGEQLVASDGRLLQAISEVSNVQLLLNDDANVVRLEGLDGVGREIARRALARLDKPSAQSSAVDNPMEWVGTIKHHLEREIRNLGKKAFAALSIPRSHPEIVDLVGRLNYRTSYTQNQWRHAVEAAFLAGMMASELGLDIKIARRATLLHDIGKALTHEIEGSHAVIGADIARRLGEDEIIANAIGAHHADEPPTSIYAYIVAACDAMSGARPGARRQLTVEYGNRLEDLERIGRSYKGVGYAHAVHGGRELRVYIEDGKLNDNEVSELSAEVAAKISEEMTFPGQIKVTVIRAIEAIAVAC